MKRLQKKAEVEFDKFLEGCEDVGGDQYNMWRSHTNKGTQLIIHQVKENEYVVLVDTDVFVKEENLKKLDEELTKAFGKVNRYDQSTCEFVINSKSEFDTLLKIVTGFNL